MLQKIILAALVLSSLNAEAQGIIVFNDNFENSTLDWQIGGSISPNKWLKGSCAGNGLSNTGDSAIYVSDGSPGIGCSGSYTYQNSPSGTNFTLIYRTIDAQCGTTLNLNFDYKTGGVPNEDYTEVVYSIDGGTIWSTIGTALSTNNSWSNLNVALPSVLDYSSFLIGFRFSYNNATISGLPTAIDNIKITGQDNQAPIIQCPNDTTLCTNVVNFTDPLYSDNCFAILTQTDGSNLASGSTFPVGNTTLSYLVTDSESNTSSCSFTITVLDFPSQAFISDDSISLCQLNSVVVEALPATSGTGQWSSLNASQATFNDPAANMTGVNNLNFGVNTLVWTISSNSCGSLSDTMNIYVYQNPLPASTLDTVLLCSQDTLNLTASFPLYGTGIWTTDKGAVISESSAYMTTATGLSNGWNQFIWTVKNGSCSSTSDTMHVYRSPLAKINQSDTMLCLENGFVELSGTPNLNEETTMWTFISGNGTISNPFLNELTVSDFNLGDNRILYTISSELCTPSMDTMLIVTYLCDGFKPIFPTVITPNFDGKNDLFVIDYLNELYPNCQVAIFNRWGSIVFESTGYASPWDGTFNNEDLPMGTYFYKIELNDDSKTVYNGPISILR